MDINLLKFDVKGDARGSLIALEGDHEIPFQIKRVYYIYGTGNGIVRGKHAHIALKQVLICVHGCCFITLDDGKERKDVLLSSPDEGLYIDSLIWREMHDFSDGAVLLVLADRVYSEADYIRNYDKFLEMANASRAGDN